MVKVYKFGGASVKNADGVRNLVEIMRLNPDNKILIVVSAMGKTTNALEKLCLAYFRHQEDIHQLLDEIKGFHNEIIRDLFGDRAQPLYDEIANTFIEIDWMLEDEPHSNFDFNYDQIVSVGELISSKIVGAYLKHCDVKTQWIDARSYIHTDNTYREGKIDWIKTRSSIQELSGQLNEQCLITQGFIGGTSENFTTTLGREGSDYTAAVFASCLNAESVTIWKDVPGVLNSDPKLFSNAKKFDELPYSEALEMAYYGASIIHPNTIKPLQVAGIPLFVKPFLSPKEHGTRIDQKAKLNTEISTIIIKKDQVLLTVSSNELSFMNEETISLILKSLSDAQIKLNMMQLSALNLSICFNNDEIKFKRLTENLPAEFKYRYNTGLDLLTVRHYKRAELAELTSGRIVLLEQFSRNTAQLILK